MDEISVDDEVERSVKIDETSHVVHENIHSNSKSSSQPDNYSSDLHNTNGIDHGDVITEKSDECNTEKSKENGVHTGDITLQASLSPEENAVQSINDNSQVRLNENNTQRATGNTADPNIEHKKVTEIPSEYNDKESEKGSIKNTDSEKPCLDNEGSSETENLTPRVECGKVYDTEEVTQSDSDKAVNYESPRSQNFATVPPQNNQNFLEDNHRESITESSSVSLKMAFSETESLRSDVAYQDNSNQQQLGHSQNVFRQQPDVITERSEQSDRSENNSVQHKPRPEMYSQKYSAPQKQESLAMMNNALDGPKILTSEPRAAIDYFVNQQNSRMTEKGRELNGGPNRGPIQGQNHCRETDDSADCSKDINRYPAMQSLSKREYSGQSVPALVERSPSTGPPPHHFYPHARTTSENSTDVSVSFLNEEERILLQQLRDAVLLQDIRKIFLIRNAIRKTNNEQWVRIFNRLEPRHQNYIVGKQREFEQKAMANEYGTQNMTPVLYSSSSTNRTQDQPPSRQISSSANTPINYQSDISRQYEEQIQGIHSQYKAKILRMEQLADQKTKMLEKEFQLTKLECQNHERRIADLLDERENYAIHIASLNEANGQLKREYSTVIERLKMSQENYVQLKTKMEQMESNSSSKCDKDVLQQILDDYNRLSREHEAFKRTALQFQHSADRQMQDLEKDNVELRNENAKLRQQLKVMEFTEHVNNASIHGQNRFSDDFHVVRNHNRQIGSGNFSPGDPRDSKSLYQLEKEYSSLEKQFDDLQLEKSAVESRLSCLGGSGFAKVGCRSVPVREERDRLEDKLEKINAELSALRLAMRQNKNFRKM